MEQFLPLRNMEDQMIQTVETTIKDGQLHLLESETLVPALSADSCPELNPLLFSMYALAAAYGQDEPDYPVTLVKEWNPKYEGR